MPKSKSLSACLANRLTWREASALLNVRGDVELIDEAFKSSSTLRPVSEIEVLVRSRIIDWICATGNLYAINIHFFHTILVSK